MDDNKLYDALRETFAEEPLMDSEEPVSYAIDWMLKYSKDARWDLLARAMDILKEKYSTVQTPSNPVGVNMFMPKKCVDCNNYHCTCAKIDLEFPEREPVGIKFWVDYLPSGDKPKKCTCDMMVLMRIGCQCGGD